MLSGCHSCSHWFMLYTPIGVKEAFLKVAQGITELYNNNLLMSTTISSSLPISATTSPLPVLNEKALADIYLYQTDSIGNWYLFYIYYLLLLCYCVVVVVVTCEPMYVAHAEGGCLEMFSVNIIIILLII